MKYKAGTGTWQSRFVAIAGFVKDGKGNMLIAKTHHGDGCFLGID